MLILYCIAVMDGTSGSDPVDNQSLVKPNDCKNICDVEVKFIPDQADGVLEKKQNVAAAGDDHNTNEDNGER